MPMTVHGDGRAAKAQESDAGAEAKAKAEAASSTYIVQEGKTVTHRRCVKVKMNHGLFQKRKKTSPGAWMVNNRAVKKYSYQPTLEFLVTPGKSAVAAVGGCVGARQEDAPGAE